jgi:type IV pilus assembly protein PilQ
MAATNPLAPATTPLGLIGIDFTKLTGTPLKISATLLAAESEGQVKIISSPKVLTLDNRTAKIRQGTQVPISRLDDSGNTVIEYKDVDLELEVTPHVTLDGRISMAIKITNNEIGQEINEEISFTTKEATTELIVNDGETIVIGGIRKTKKDELESGVPGLMKIPMLGWLFKTQTKSEELQELLIFITPRIVQLEQRDKLKRFSTGAP